MCKRLQQQKSKLEGYAKLKKNKKLKTYRGIKSASEELLDASG